jgi:transposase
VGRSPNNLPTEAPSYRRVEVLSGTPPRRRWSEEEKASIVAESLSPGAVARHVALRHGVHPNQLHAWRRDLACGMVGERAAQFVPVALSSGEAGAAGAMEIAVAGAVIRVRPGVDQGLLRAVLQAVRSTQ